MVHPTLRLASLLALTVLSPAAMAQLTVGAASELRPALDEVSKLYTERTGNPLRVVYAPPSTLVTKAAKGGMDCVVGPSEWIDSLRLRGISVENPVFLASSPLVAWSRQGGPLPDSQLAFLLDTTLRGIAVSDPVQSPDGSRVLPFLEALSADSLFRARWRVAAEPGAAIDTLLAGRADAALLPQSAFWSSPVGGQGRQLVMDSARMGPQRTYSVVLNVTPDRKANATAFLEWARGPQAKGIWRRKGYILP